MIEKWKINEAAFKCSTSYSGNEFVECVKWAEKEIFEDDDITNLLRKYHDVNVKAMSMFNKISDKIIFKGFEDYEDGSLFAEFHIENDEIWEQIKNGTYKGFSLAGVFDLIPEEFKKEKTQDETDYEECLKLIEKINKKLKRK